MSWAGIVLIGIFWCHNFDVFSYQVVSENANSFRENSLQSLSSNFEQLIFNDEWTSFLCHVKFILLHSKFFPPNLSKKFTLQKKDFTLQRNFCHDGSILGHLKLLLIMLILIIYLNTNANFYMKFQSPVFLLLQNKCVTKIKICSGFMKVDQILKVWSLLSPKIIIFIKLGGTKKNHGSNSRGTSHTLTLHQNL